MTTNVVLTLDEFLHHRIAEDAVTARWGRVVDDPSDPESATGILRWDHDRLSAECKAKRQIMEMHDGSHECAGPEDNCMWITSGEACPTIRALAAIYSDHPDHREEWRP